VVTSLCSDSGELKVTRAPGTQLGSLIGIISITVLPSYDKHKILTLQAVTISSDIFLSYPGSLPSLYLLLLYLFLLLGGF
jgi:hypothetical protein